MFWVVQHNLYNEYGYESLLSTLVKYNIPHAIVKPVPFFDRLLPADFDSHEYKGSIDALTGAVIDESGLIMCCGSLTLARIAHQRGWKPGHFNNENFTFEKWRQAWGENLLNFDAIVTTVGKVTPIWNEFFIRPVEDTKSFSGMVVTWDEWSKWINGVLELNDCWNVKNDTGVMFCPLKKIYTETRFFVVDGKLITWSEYKLGVEVHYSRKMVSQNVIDYAQKMVDIWQPSRAFVIDIAETPEGMKVVEINCFNSAGFYDCDVAKIVEAVEGMEY